MDISIMNEANLKQSEQYMSALSSVKSKFDPEEVAGWPREKRLEQLREHFSTGHSDIIRTTSHTKTGSGFPAAEVINAMNPDLVLDLGCGFSLFKEHIQGLIGVDLLPYQGRVDLVMDCDDALELFQDNSVDAIRCVGPFNFGTQAEQEKLIGLCYDKLKPGGVVCGHARPGRKSDATGFNSRGIIHYPWTRTAVQEFTDLFGWELCDPHLSVPGWVEQSDHKSPIITEWTDLRQLSWPQLKDYMVRFNPDDTPIDDFNKWLDREHDNSDMFDPLEYQEGLKDAHVKVQNEFWRRMKDERYNRHMHDGVRPRYNWWWRKP